MARSFSGEWAHILDALYAMRSVGGILCPERFSAYHEIYDVDIEHLQQLVWNVDECFQFYSPYPGIPVQDSFSWVSPVRAM